MDSSKDLETVFNDQARLAPSARHFLWHVVLNPQDYQGVFPDLRQTILSYMLQSMAAADKPYARLDTVSDMSEKLYSNALKVMEKDGHIQRSQDGLRIAPTPRMMEILTDRTRKQGGGFDFHDFSPKL